jgi:hypothetical protein
MGKLGLITHAVIAGAKEGIEEDRIKTEHKLVRENINLVMAGLTSGTANMYTASYHTCAKSKDSFSQRQSSPSTLTGSKISRP